MGQPVSRWSRWSRTRQLQLLWPRGVGPWGTGPWGSGNDPQTAQWRGWEAVGKHTHTSPEHVGVDAWFSMSGVAPACLVVTTKGVFLASHGGAQACSCTPYGAQRMISPRRQLCRMEHLGCEQEAVQWQGGHRPGECRVCGCRPGGVPPGCHTRGRRRSQAGREVTELPDGKSGPECESSEAVDAQ